MSSIESPPPPTAPSAPGHRSAALALRPPQRGDRLALSAVVAASLLYAWITIHLWRAGLIKPESPLLLWLAWSSIALSVMGLALTLARDVRRLFREERAVQVLLDAHGAKDPLAELVTRMSDVGRGTLAGDLARRVDQARPGGRAATPTELRAIAAAHSAGLGSLARFLSQLLLLLTVLGTFMGVREALPELVSTLTATTGAGSLSAQRLGDVLNAVGDAFGSNLGALLGSIALGIAGYGLGAGRRAMLSRLELAAVQHVYPELERRSGSSVDTEAIRALQVATESLAALGGLPNAVRGLEEAVAASSTETARLLEQALDRERQILFTETREHVRQLEALVTDVATAVMANAGQYATIAGALASRDRDFAAAVREIGTVAEKLHEVSDSHGAHVRGMASDVLKALSQIDITLNESITVAGGVREDVGGARQDLQALIGSAREVASGLVAAQTAADDARQSAAERERTALATLREEHARALAEAEAHQRATLDRVEAELVRLVAERLTPSVGELRGSVDALRGSVDGVRDATEAGVLEAFRRARAERTGGGGDDVAAVLERIARLVENLDAPADQLVRALRDLTRRMETGKRTETRWWKRLPRLLGRGMPEGSSWRDDPAAPPPRPRVAPPGGNGRPGDDAPRADDRRESRRDASPAEDAADGVEAGTRTRGRGRPGSTGAAERPPHAHRPDGDTATARPGPGSHDAASGTRAPQESGPVEPVVEPVAGLRREEQLSAEPHGPEAPGEPAAERDA